MVARAFNPSTQELDLCELGQPGLYSKFQDSNIELYCEILSQKKNPKKPMNFKDSSVRVLAA